MSELQVSLLVIGVAAVAAVYVYNWVQQRNYRRKFGAVFGQKHDDALLRETVEQPVAEEIVAEELEELEQAPPAASSPQTEALPETPRATVMDSMCTLLGEATDYVAVLEFDVPAGADSLALLWKNRFDFGKSVHVCGLNSAAGTWEKVIQESHLFYAAFKISLQLADRSGAVSEVRLSDFRDLVSGIAAQLDARVSMPDVATACARAQELDAFCAEVDQMVGLNILPSGERTFSGGEVARVAEQHGLLLQADGTFHFADANGHTVFSLGNYESEPFQHHTLPGMWVRGLTLLLDVPRVEHPVQRFEEMAVQARKMAMGLHAALVDDRRVALGEPGIAQIRDQVADIEKRMLDGGIAPGSMQARRLFS